MKEVTAWKVYKTISNDGVEDRVLVAHDPNTNKGIVEPVTTTGNREVNGYALVGSHNIYHQDYVDLWSNWITSHNINSIYDISSQFE